MLGTLETWARRVWGERDEAAIDEIRAPDAEAHGLARQALADAEGFKAFHRQVCRLLTQTHLAIDHHIEADDWLAARCTFSGTTADGRRVAMRGAIHVRTEGGMIREAHNYFDFLSLFMQMGLLPSDSLERCMAGQRVC
jgi:ketosteroid isomerase-like protein